MNLDPGGDWSKQIRYETTTFVRSKRPRNTWVSWNHRLGGGPVLTIRADDFEVRAPQGWVGSPRQVVVNAANAKMSVDRIGWAGTALDRKRCIHIVGRDQVGEIELALSPDSDFDAAWEALERAGVEAV